MSCRNRGLRFAVLLSICLIVTAPMAAQGRFAPRTADTSNSDNSQIQSAPGTAGPADESSNMSSRIDSSGTPSASSPAGNGGLQITGAPGGSVPWNIIVMLTALTLVPSILVCMTPFARLLIVFHFLRQALGLQTTPSNQTLIGLSVIMTFFLMQPVGDVVYRDSIIPLQQGKITAIDAVARGAIPMRQFMSHFVREKDVALFLDIAKEPRP